MHHIAVGRDVVVAEVLGPAFDRSFLPSTLLPSNQQTCNKRNSILQVDYCKLRNCRRSTLFNHNFVQKQPVECEPMGVSKWLKVPITIVHSVGHKG